MKKSLKHILSILTCVTLTAALAFPVQAAGVSSIRMGSYKGARPIVLLSWKEGGKVFLDAVGGESRYLGAFLPCTGLHQLLTEEAGPLIMTSCNVDVYKRQIIREIFKAS